MRGQFTREPTLALVCVVLACTLAIRPSASAGENMLVIDDRQSGDFHSLYGTSWRLVTDQVMGGVSDGQLTIDEAAGRSCIRLRGQVRLENRGGFLQAALDLSGGAGGAFSRYEGVLLDVYGNGETYNVHLRTTATRLPWQSYRASFQAPARWQTVRLPFSRFEPYRLDTPLDVSQVRRIGLVAIGRAFSADLCLGALALYDDLEGPET